MRGLIRWSLGRIVSDSLGHVRLEVSEVGACRLTCDPQRALAIAQLRLLHAIRLPSAGIAGHQSAADTPASILSHSHSRPCSSSNCCTPAFHSFRNTPASTHFSTGSTFCRVSGRPCAQGMRMGVTFVTGKDTSMTWPSALRVIMPVTSSPSVTCLEIVPGAALKL